jgi:ferric-dicitrate binding protein FerR (iron transport regulator)
MSQRNLEIVTKMLRQDRAPTPTRFPPDRARLVAVVERGLRARRRRRMLERGLVVTGVAAAASLALLVGGLTFLHPRTAPPVALGTATGAAPAALALASAPSPHALTVLSSPPAPSGQAGVMVGGSAAPIPLAQGMTLSRGLRLVAPPAGEVRVGAARGTTLTLEGGGEMSISEEGVLQRYELRAGAVRAQVAKLIAGERFIIATADSEVEVHGTAFRVALVPPDPECGAGTTTRVSVTEGVVTVRRGGVEARVLPGGVWPEGCDRSSAAVLPGGARRAAVRARSGGLAHAALSSSSTGGGKGAGLDEGSESLLAPDRPLSKSELAAQNDLFASAVRAKREGRGSEAVRIFERFGREYPRSPLAESAAAQRMKLLGTIDLPGARRAASEYLARYPSGFARADAQALMEIKTSGF